MVFDVVQSIRVEAVPISVCKRTFDVLLAMLGFVVGGPIILLIALAIRLDSPGDVIFAQERLGAGGKPFRLFKFRKFPANWGSKGPGVTVAGDVRMTRIGRMLERTKLDELPQLWNILKGEMSFVGPRPESLKYADMFSGEFSDVLRYRPGIFGPNQIDYRNESEMYPADEDPEIYYRRVLFPAKARQDLAYFSQANCLSDVAWIVKGVFVSVIGTINWGRVVRRQLPVVLLDVVAVAFAWAIAVSMRYGVGEAISGQHQALLIGLWLFPLVVIPALIVFGNYRHTLRHIVLADIVDQAVVAAFAWGGAFLLLLYLGDRNISLMLAPLGFVIALLFMIVPRVFYKEFARRRDVFGNSGQDGINLLIYGTDDRAINLGSLIQRGFPGVNLIGFIDDTGDIQGRSILDLRILGSERDLPTIQAVHHFDQLWFSQVPEMRKLNRIRRWADDEGVEIVILPALKPFDSLIGGDRRDVR